MRTFGIATLTLLAALGLCAGEAQDRATVLSALKHGGLYIVMRHASSPRDPPDAAHVVEGNTDRERQLDETGRSTAAAMGEAIRALGVSVGEVLTSPTWRARETATLAGFRAARSVPALGDGGHGMQGVDEEHVRWLRETVTRPPGSGNGVLITHLPNLAAAFPSFAAGLADGEALILKPEPGGARLVGRVRIEDWPRWAKGR